MASATRLSALLDDRHGLPRRIEVRRHTVRGSHPVSENGRARSCHGACNKSVNRARRRCCRRESGPVTSPRKRLPMMKASARPLGFACVTYSKFKPHWLPSPRSSGKGGVTGIRDDENVSDPGQHQSRERVVDHRFVVYRHQLFADDQGQRIEPVRPPARTMPFGSSFSPTRSPRYARANIFPPGTIAEYQETVSISPMSLVAGFQPSSCSILEDQLRTGGRGRACRVHALSTRSSWPVCRGR